MNDGILLVPHLGLGDAIILNGMVRSLAASHSVAFPCKEHNLPSVRWMFSDLPNVNVVGVWSDEEMLSMARGWRSGRVVNIGMFGDGWMKDGDGRHFDEQMYDACGVNFECSWSHFKVPEIPCRVDPIVDIFLCDDPARGYRIDTTKVRCGNIRRPHISDTIFYWRPYIENANEIHCIDSSFRNWIDRMPHKPDQKLFWHRYARHYPDKRFDPNYRRPWAVLE